MIAVQEGRGVGSAAYFWPSQNNTAIAAVDPLLLQMLNYRFAGRLKEDVTFGEIYYASTRTLNRLFHDAVQVPAL